MQRAGYDADFLTLAAIAIAIAAFVVFWQFVLETNQSKKAANTKFCLHRILDNYVSQKPQRHKPVKIFIHQHNFF